MFNILSKEKKKKEKRLILIKTECDKLYARAQESLKLALAEEDKNLKKEYLESNKKFMDERSGILNIFKKMEEKNLL